MTAVAIRLCESHNDVRVCMDLQRRIWGGTDEDIVLAWFCRAPKKGSPAANSPPALRAAYPVADFACCFSQPE
jgi:hypothetical protein